MSLSKLLSLINADKGAAQFVRFVVVGGAATMTDLMVSVILIYGFNLHENIVTTAAFAVAFFVSYFGHRSFTFKKGGSALRFLALSVSMLLVRNLLVALMVSLGLRGLPPLILAMGMVMALTFVLSKYLVFKA